MSHPQTPWITTCRNPDGVYFAIRVNVAADQPTDVQHNAALQRVQTYQPTPLVAVPDTGQTTVTYDPGTGPITITVIDQSTTP